MAIILILVLLVLPSISGLTQSSNLGAAQTMLRSLFASARATAANTQEYVGVRFQQDRFGRAWAVILRTPTDVNLASAKGYKNYLNGCPIDLIKEGIDLQVPPENLDQDNFMGGFEYPSLSNCDFLGLVAAEDIQPIRLPKGLEFAAGTISQDADLIDLDRISKDPADWRLADNISFTIVFDPSGQIVRKRVFVGQRGYVKLSPSPVLKKYREQRHDIIFNYHFNYDILYNQPSSIPVEDIPANDREEQPFLLPDVNVNLPIDDPDFVRPEISQNSIWIYERQRRIDAPLEDIDGDGDLDPAPFTGYVRTQGLYVQLNVYTGSLINPRQE
jgi:hypothetical protein